MIAQAAEPPDSSVEKELLARTADIATAYLSNNAVPASDVPNLLQSIYATLTSLTLGTPLEVLKPAVPIKRSITETYLVCLEDGAKLKMLKRYLHSRFGMTPDEYRHKWNLPADYPMVAPAYAATRSELAKKSGLGTHPQERRRRA